MSAGPDLFDATAAGFASSIDRSRAAGTYLRGELFLAAVKAVAPSGARILDYGCGPGRISRMLAEAGYAVLGVDPSSEMIRQAGAQDLGSLRMELAIASEVPTAVRFDAIVCSSVIEYVEDPPALLAAFHGAIVPGGALVISFANALSLWRGYARLVSGRRKPHFSRQRYIVRGGAFVDDLEAAGFSVMTHPRYFESPFDACQLGRSRFVGTLGLVTARRT